MNRRSFVRWIGLGWLAAVAQGCLARLGGGQSTSPTGAAVVGSVADLDRAGVLEGRTAAGPVLVTRDRTDPNSLRAVNPTCTHQGCTVRWQAQAQELQCPCHGARFAADGAVLQGPAGNALGTYSARIEGSDVVIDA